MAKLTETECRRCGRMTIGGWSGTGELLSVQVTADADPLENPWQELLAILAGCTTWTLHPVARQLHYRSARMIRLRPVGHPRQTVHADHRCTPRPWRSWT